jgi:hypothetical protein
VNGTRIIWRILVWLAGILSIILLPAVYAMLIMIVLAHWFTIVIFLIVVVGFPLAAHIEHSKR